MRLNRVTGLVVLGWAVLFAALAAGLWWLGVGSTVFGGALGAYCGATLVVIFTIRERVARRRRDPPGHLQSRYGRR